MIKTTLSSSKANVLVSDTQMGMGKPVDEQTQNAIYITKSSLGI